MNLRRIHLVSLALCLLLSAPLWAEPAPAQPSASPVEVQFSPTPSPSPAQAPPMPEPQASPAQAQATPLASSSQVVVVVGNGWNDLHATLQCFERTPSGWRAVGPSIPATVGRNGLGWGRGVVPVKGADGPVKREGDGRAPAGVFRITGTFGFAPAQQAGIRMPYTQLSDSIEAVDDVRSKYYNEVVDATKVTRDWTSAEHMRGVTVYQWGAFVGHNIAPPQPGAGSAIFIHLWKGPDAGTAGCTALEKAPLVTMLKWLQPDKQPLLVQLPREAYARLRAGWKLP